MTNKQWHPDDLQKVFPKIPESCSRALMDTAGSLREENEMKKNFTISRLPRFAFVLVLIIISTLGIALAAFYPQITAVFGQHYGQQAQAWLEKGKIALPADSVQAEGVTFTLDEVVYRNHGLYGLGTVTPSEGIVLLSEEGQINDAYGYAVRYGDEASDGTPSILEEAVQNGCAIKQVRFRLEKISVDGGELTVPNTWGCCMYPQRDGSIRFLFEAEDGNAVFQSEKYTIQMTAGVCNVSSDGKADHEHPVDREWTVEIVPHPFSEVVELADAAEQAHALIAAPAADECRNELQIIAPEAYTQNGTLPVYKAKTRDFSKTINYAWFNHSGISKEQVSAGSTCGMVDFNDEGHLEWDGDFIAYSTYDGTYEAVGRLSDGSIFTETLPKHAMVSDVSAIAMWMTHGFPEAGKVYALESTQLETIGLGDAQTQAEALMTKLGMAGYTCTTALDMGVERIHDMGALYNQAIDSGSMMTNAFRYDYTAATTADEGYYLIYHKFGNDGDLARQFEADFYVTADGIRVMDIRDAYEPGEIVSTPTALVDAQTIVSTLPIAIADSRFADEVKQIKRATLTWMPVHAKDDSGMVMTPVWVLSYTTAEGQQQGYEDWAVFDAIDGTLVDAIFN